MNSCQVIISGSREATGVGRHQGMFDPRAPDRPDPTKLATAVASLDEGHPPEDVALYLSVCAEQWPESRTRAEYERWSAG